MKSGLMRRRFPCINVMEYRLYEVHRIVKIELSSHTEYVATLAALFFIDDTNFNPILRYTHTATDIKERCQLVLNITTE